MNDQEINLANHKFYGERDFSHYNPTKFFDKLTFDDKDIILKHGEWLKALAEEIIKPYTEVQEKFLKVSKGELTPKSKFEIAWKNYIWINNASINESNEWKNFQWEPGLLLNDLTSHDRETIIKYGRFLKALDLTLLKPCNQAQDQFVRVCRGLVEPNTEYENAWFNFKKLERNQPKKENSEKIRENDDLKVKLKSLREENDSLLFVIKSDNKQKEINNQILFLLDL